MSIVSVALEQMEFARKYTNELLDAIDLQDWFAMPGGVTHVAWQVGHLAMAEYRLLLDRVRGPRPDDAELLTDQFLQRFARESDPSPDPAAYPSPAELRATLDRVHEHVLRDLPSVPEGSLDEPLIMPHRLCRTKKMVLFWCPQHEFLHAGQIGLLRRQLGKAYLW
jgi:hypothetical protein